jgi:uncharacterized double-CXXCG motif protein
LRFYQAATDTAAPYTSDLSARHRWHLPSVLDCPGSGPGVFGTDAVRYPCADLTGLPNLQEFEDPSPQSLDVYLRLSEQVRPLLPPGAVMKPGMALGPMVGRASGTFSPLSMQNPWSLYLLRDALERLQGTAIRGLRGFPMELRRFRGRNPPDLLEADLLIRGELHADCLPPDAKTCEQCGAKNYSLPDPFILDASTLPTDVDLFRLAGWSSLIIVTERFVDAVKQLNLDGVIFREVPVR